MGVVDGAVVCTVNGGQQSSSTRPLRPSFMTCSARGWGDDAMSLHPNQHPLAGATVAIDGISCRVEDWWDRVSGSSWRAMSASTVVIVYKARVAGRGLPPDDDVVYVHHGAGRQQMGLLVHESEIA